MTPPLPPLDPLEPWCVAPGHPRMTTGTTTPSCAVSCHSYYNVQHYFSLEKVWAFFVSHSLCEEMVKIKEHKLTCYCHFPCPVVFLVTTGCLAGQMSFFDSSLQRHRNTLAKTYSFNLYEMDTNNLDTDTYVLVSTVSSWLQNKHSELIKHIHTSHIQIFSKTSCYLGYFHIPANQIIITTKK